MTTKNILDKCKETEERCKEINLLKNLESFTAKFQLATDLRVKSSAEEYRAYAIGYLVELKKSSQVNEQLEEQIRRYEQLLGVSQ